MGLQVRLWRAAHFRSHVHGFYAQAHSPFLVTWERLWLGRFEFWTFTVSFWKIRCVRSRAFFSVRVFGLLKVSVLLVCMNFRSCPWFRSGIRRICHCRNRSSTRSARLLIFKAPAVWNFRSVHAAFLVTWSPQPFSILLGRIRVAWLIKAMFFIMTQVAANITEGGQPLIFKIYPGFLPIKIEDVTSSAQRLVEGNINSYP